jgi:hypothetical protein
MCAVDFSARDFLPVPRCTFFVEKLDFNFESKHNHWALSELTMEVELGVLIGNVFLGALSFVGCSAKHLKGIFQKFTVAQYLQIFEPGVLRNRMGLSTGPWYDRDSSKRHGHRSYPQQAFLFKRTLVAHKNVLKPP